MRKGKLSRGVRLVVLLVLTAAGFVVSHSTKVTAQSSLTIVTDWAPYGVHGPLFLAAQRGWFKDAGLDVTILDGKGSASSLQLLGAEKADVAFVQLSTMAAAIDKGLPVISVAGFVRSGDNGTARSSRRRISRASGSFTPQDRLPRR